MSHGSGAAEPPLKRATSRELTSRALVLASAEATASLSSRRVHVVVDGGANRLFDEVPSILPHLSAEEVIVVDFRPQCQPAQCNARLSARAARLTETLCD